MERCLNIGLVYSNSYFSLGHLLCLIITIYVAFMYFLGGNLTHCMVQVNKPFLMEATNHNNLHLTFEYLHASS